MGARHIIFKDNDKVRVFSEDGEENTDRLPQTIAEISKLEVKDAIFDVEIEAWDGDKHLPREVVAGYLHAKWKADDSSIVTNVFGLLYLDGRDLHKEPEEKRRELLEKIKFPQSTINEPDLKYRLNLVPSKVARNVAELKKIVEDLRWRPASEGVVVKKHDAIYYLDRNSRNGWFKLHNTALLAGIVVEVIETKVKGVYNYRYAIDQGDYKIKPGDLAEVKDREWLEVGKTFSTERKVDRGDIIEIEFETLNFIRDEKSGTVRVTAWVPRFMRALPERSTPDKMSDIVERARKNKILWEKVVTAEGKTIYEGLVEGVEVEYLDQAGYIQFLKEAYGIDGKTIEWYLEVERFLETVEDWRPTEEEIRETERVDPEFGKALRKAQAEAKKLPRFWAVIQNHFRGKSQHKDFRVKMNLFLKGWTITDLPKGAITEDVETVEDGRRWQEKVKFKFRPDMDPATHCVAIAKAKQPAIWIMWDDKGMGKYAAAPPGSVTATRFEWGVMVLEDEGYAYPTCFPAGQKVLTTEGMKNIETIKTGDYVIGESGQSVRVTGNFVRPFSGDLIKLRVRGLPAVMLTPEHPVFSHRSITYKDRCLGRDKSGRSLYLKNAGFEPKGEWKETGNLKVGDYCAIPRYKKTDGEKVFLEVGDRKYEIDSELAWLIGLFVADGHARRLIPAQFEFALSDPKHVRKVEEIMETKFGLVGRRSLRPGHTRLIFNSRDLVETLRKEFYALDQKRMPMELLRVSDDVCISLLKGLYDGDGSKKSRNGTLRFAVTSLDVIIFFQLALAKLGYCGGGFTASRLGRGARHRLIGIDFSGKFLNLLEDKPEVGEVKITKFLLNGDYVFSRVEEIEKIPFSGKVYNLETEDHVIMVPFKTHNCKKPYFEEYFLDMKKYKGRMVVRLIGVRPEWEKPPKGKLQWQTWNNLKDQTPYILTRRARLRKDYVPDGVNTTDSGLPPWWEEKIPIVMRWWVGKLSRAEKLARMDQAYNYLIEKGELKGTLLKESPEPRVADFIIRRHWWRGAVIIRGMPVQHWDLVIDSGKDYLDEFNLELDPLIKENLEAGIPAFRKKCEIGTPKGEPFRKWMEFEGSIPPNHPEWGNPNKKIPAYMKIVDKGKVNWIEDTDLFSSFEFKGKAVKGYVTIRREDPESEIWVMQRAALPGERRKEAVAVIGE